MDAADLVFNKNPIRMFGLTKLQKTDARLIFKPKQYIFFIRQSQTTLP